MHENPLLMRYIDITNLKEGFFMKKIRLLVIAALIGTLMMCPIYAAAETPEGITEIVYPEVYLDDVDEDMNEGMDMSHE